MGGKLSYIFNVLLELLLFYFFQTIHATLTTPIFFYRILTLDFFLQITANLK